MTSHFHVRSYLWEQRFHQDTPKLLIICMIIINPLLEMTDTVHATPTKPSPLPVFGIMARGLYLDFAHSLSLEWQRPKYAMRIASFSTSLQVLLHVHVVGPPDAEKSHTSSQSHFTTQCRLCQEDSPPTSSPPYVSARNITKYNKSLMDP